jgi:acyl-CoA thioester hydrolase
MSSFRWPVRVYYENTDAGGVVYHAEYLKFFERARSEWLRFLGFAHPDLKALHGIVFVVRQMRIKYRQPARFDDLLEVETTLDELGRSKIVFNQKLLRGQACLTEAAVEVVCVDSETFRLAAMPESMTTKMKPYLPGD